MNKSITVMQAEIMESQSDRSFEQGLFLADPTVKPTNCQIISNINLFDSSIITLSVNSADDLAEFVYQQRDSSYMVLDQNDTIVAATPTLCRKLGLGNDDIIGKKSGVLNLIKSISDINNHLQFEPELNYFEKPNLFIRFGQNNVYTEWFSLIKTTKRQNFELNIIQLPEPDQVLPCYRGSSCFSFIDYLTGLPNRFLLLDRLKVAIN